MPQLTIAAVDDRSANLQARRADAADETFLLRSMAHDLKNQLQTVVGYCDLLAAEGPPVADRAIAPPRGLLLSANVADQALKAAGYVGRIRGAARQCARIAEAMMTPPAGDRREPPPTVDLNALLLDEVGLLSGDLVRHGINVHVERAANLPDVRMDPLALARVILNLAHNAREAILSGAGEVVAGCRDAVAARIVFATNRLPGVGALLTVADDGPGMSPEVQARVWEAGYSTRAPAGSGRRGFGLAVVRNCVEGAGGRVELDSQPGRGTMFRLYLPTTG